MSKKPIAGMPYTDAEWIEMGISLYIVCKAFVRQHNIHCAEVIGDRDSVIESAYDLIEDIANIVGYEEIEDD